jgi:hypothetical protein
MLFKTMNGENFAGKTDDEVLELYAVLCNQQAHAQSEHRRLSKDAALAKTELDKITSQLKAVAKEKKQRRI